MRRIAAALLSLAWLSSASSALAVLWLHSDPRFLGQLPFFGIMLVFAATGAVLAAVRPRNPIGWLLSAIAMFDGLDGLGSAIAPNLPQLTASMPTAFFVALTASLGLQIFGVIPLILLLFPNGRLLSRRWRIAAFGPPLASVLAGLAILLAEGPVLPSVAILKPFGAEALTPVAAVLRPIAIFAFVLGIGVGVWSLVRRYRRGSHIDKQQIKWMAASGSLIGLFFLTLFLMLLVRNFVPSAFDDSVVLPIVTVWNAIAQLSMPVAIGIAITRYRLYDIDLLINRALVYGAVTALLAVTYFGAVVLIQSLLRPFTSGSELAVAASTLLVVALFQPLRRRVQDAVDRRFYRSRYDAVRTLDAFGARLRDEVDLDSVRADLLGVVGETLRPAHASVWLRKSGR